jgi:perosamine synthetase
MESSDIPMSAPDLDASDEQAVLSVLRSGQLSLGPQVEDFEQLVAGYVGVDHAVATSSGTAALHLIVRCLGLGPGDEVLVPSFTFAASVNAVLYEQATPVFVDIEPRTQNIDPTRLEEAVGPKTRAIMVVDVFGHPAEWSAIARIAEEHGLLMIDDACEAIGAEHDGRRLGSFGDAAAFAFYPNKQMTTGEGGMLVTNRTDVAEVARSLRNQGRPAMGGWLEHERLGFNYRMDELSASLGVSQFRRLEDFLRKREDVAAAYSERLSVFEWVRTPVVLPNVRKSWFVYVVMLEEDVDRDDVMRAMAAVGIPTRAYFAPIHLQPYIRDRFGFRGGELPVTESVAARSLALPFHNNLTEGQIDRVVEALAKAVIGGS